MKVDGFGHNTFAYHMMEQHCDSVHVVAVQGNTVWVECVDGEAVIVRVIWRADDAPSAATLAAHVEALRRMLTLRTDEAVEVRHWSNNIMVRTVAPVRDIIDTRLGPRVRFVGAGHGVLLRNIDAVREVT